LLSAALERRRATARMTTQITVTLIERYQESAAAQTETQLTVDRFARAVLTHCGDGPTSSPPRA
jgi:hypothetical protein